MRYIVIIFLFFSISASCQKDLSSKTKFLDRHYNKALNLYNKGNYSNVLKEIAIIEKRDSSFIKGYLLEAGVYGRLRDTINEIKILEKLLPLINTSYSRVYFFLANLYFGKGLYVEALETYRSFLKNANKTDRRRNAVNRAILNCQFIISLGKEKTDIQIKRLDFINTKENEYWPYLTNSPELFYFTRIVGRESVGNEDIYSYNTKTKETKAIPVNTIYNEGTPSVTGDGRYLYFSSNNPVGYGRFDIYRVEKTNNVWGNLINLGGTINTSGWESQPSISLDGQTLFFASNRKGGKGKSDIWVSHIIDKNRYNKPIWSKPVSLSFNTNDDEMAPYIHKDNMTLYFSSKGLPGMGGYDIYTVKYFKDKCSTPINISHGINSSNDEIGFCINQLGDKAYYSSNISGNKDIYQLELPKDLCLPPVSSLNISVYDKESKAKIACNVLIDKESYCLSEGEMTIPLHYGLDSLIYIKAKGYKYFRDTISLFGNSEVKKLDVFLEKIKAKDIIILKRVNFNYDSYVLRKGSYRDLDDFAKFLILNGNLNIEVGGHTDNIGSDEYNMRLSIKRAKVVFDYLLSKGVSKERILYKGYGKTIPLKDTSQNHANSRRTEFKIISIVEG